MRARTLPRRGLRGMLRLAMCSVIVAAIPGHAASVDACGPQGDFADRVIVQGSVDAVRAALVDGLTVPHERDDPFYRRYGFTARGQSGTATWEAALVASAEKPLFAQRWFRDPAHGRDLYVHFMGLSVVSSGWCSRGRAVHAAVTYVLTLRATGPDRTEIVVAADESRVTVGKSFNAHAMGRVADVAAHEPAAADRYRLLVYAAHLAGTQLAPIEQPDAKR